MNMCIFISFCDTVTLTENCGGRLLLLVGVGPVVMLLLLFVCHRPLHPLLCPVPVVDVCAAAATVYSSVGINCHLHAAAQALRAVLLLLRRITETSR